MVTGASDPLLLSLSPLESHCAYGAESALLSVQLALVRIRPGHWAGCCELRASSRSMMLRSRPPRPEAASRAIVKSLAMKCTISCVTQPAAARRGGLQWRAGGAACTACQRRPDIGVGCNAGSLGTPTPAALDMSRQPGRAQKPFQQP